MRRFVLTTCLLTGLAAIAATPARAQTDYLQQSPHSPIVMGWKTPSALPVATVAAAAPPPATPFDESRSLGEGRSAYKRTETQSSDGVKSAPGWSGGWMLSTITALAMVVGLILIIRAAYAKFTGRTIATSRTDLVQVMARVPVAPRNHVLLLRVAGRILVVGDSPNGMNTLAEIDDPDEIAGMLKTLAANQPSSITQGFGQLMSRYSSQHGAEEGGDETEHAADQARNEVSGLLSRLRSAKRGVVE